MAQNIQLFGPRGGFLTHQWIRIHYLVEKIECRQAFLSKFDIQSAGVTLKMCQGHQNLIIFALCLNGVSMQVWSKSTN